MFLKIRTVHAVQRKEIVMTRKELIQRQKMIVCMEYIARCINNEEYIYQVPPGDFLSTPQDSRGIPIGSDNSYQKPISCEIYDYSTIPDIVVTNGREDWPLCVRRSVLMA